ncbi:hypothetical protein ACJJIR_16780 [Microbulbifer sp. SSSA008]|uniref:hypothetical protein n=1 Tax=Microbulbifer sp. SSSA008 TaxID=3243380 RepID=UPI00403933FD
MKDLSKKIFNKIKEAFGNRINERLKHKKFSPNIGHLKLNIGMSGSMRSAIKDGSCRTILVTGNDGNLKTVSGVIHAEQKLVAALEQIENRFFVQNVWVAGCKRACSVCYQKLNTFRESKKSEYEFEFESHELTACQGNQRHVAYD